MKKRLICLAMAICCLTTGTLVNAQIENYIFAEYKCYKANVYVCDPENNQIILQNVAPVKVTDGLQGARNLEYTAINVSLNGLYQKNGKKLNLDTINEYLLDQRATVLVGVNGYGYTAVYLCFD